MAVVDVVVPADAVVPADMGVPADVEELALEIAG